jgi:hypothetical protein
LWLEAGVLACFPHFFFFNFLYYTDPGSTFYVLMCFAEAQRRSPIKAALLGAIAVLFRQTNIVWVCFAAATSMMMVVDQAAARNHTTDNNNPSSNSNTSNGAGSGRRMGKSQSTPHGGRAAVDEGKLDSSAQNASAAPSNFVHCVGWYSLHTMRHLGKVVGEDPFRLSSS